jgi:hypothetical protein
MMQARWLEFLVVAERDLAERVWDWNNPDLSNHRSGCRTKIGFMPASVREIARQTIGLELCAVMGMFAGSVRSRIDFVSVTLNYRSTAW